MNRRREQNRLDSTVGDRRYNRANLISASVRHPKPRRQCQSGSDLLRY